MRNVAWIASLLVLAACSAREASSSPLTSVDSGIDTGVPPGTTYSISFPTITVQPGEENTQCIVQRLGNLAPVHVGTIHDLLSQGSHHMIVYRSNETVEQTTPFNCKPFTDTLDPTKGSTIVVTQKHDDTLQLPPGVAFTLDADQMVRIELHFINPQPAALQVTATSTFVTMDDATFQNEAGFLFIGDPDIKLPPHATTTLGPITFTVPPDYAGVNFFAITGHEHQFGTSVTASVVANATDTGTSVYDVPGWLWSEPTTVQSNPPFNIPSGGGFRFSCEWNNTSDNEVKFGESATDEMCFFWAYYYPSLGSRVCIHSDQLKGGIDICCPGPSLYCALLLQKVDADGG